MNFKLCILTVTKSLTLAIALCSVVLLTSCNSEDESYSAFAELLTKPPYKSITDSIGKQPQRDDLYFRRAILLNKNNQPFPALEDFRKAWSLNKLEPYATGVSNILIDTKPDSAVAFIRQALQDLPQSIYLQITLARTYSALEKNKEALDVCQTILQQYPDQLNTLMLASEIYEKTGDQVSMISMLERAYSLAPAQREIANSLAYQYAETKNAKTIPLADSLLRTDTLHQYPEPVYVKGLYYSNIKQDADALKWFDLTIQNDHRFLQAYIEKGKIQLDQKKFNDALKTFTLANEISPAFPDAWYWMGMAQEKLGLKKEAQDNYEKAYGLDKTFTEARDAMKRLGS
ncbi:MAG: tetratricopeptide repeat protein [Chitinophagaceae bacterium]|nr:MAG: tetratricopeptide repeat protein [Chitinophagaceae bacterium]